MFFSEIRLSSEFKGGLTVLAIFLILLVVLAVHSYFFIKKSDFF